MPALIQVCVVIATLSVLAVAVVMVRALQRFERAADEWSRVSAAWRHTALEAESVIREASALTATLRGAAIPLQNAARRLEAVASRATHLSHDVLDEVVAPVQQVAALIAGVRTGARTLAEAWQRRIRGTHNGGQDHDGP